LPNIVEYSLQPLRQRLNDPSAYVRKTAVLGVVKLFTRHPHIVKSKGRASIAAVAVRTAWLTGVL